MEKGASKFTKEGGDSEVGTESSTLCNRGKLMKCHLCSRGFINCHYISCN